MELLRNWKKEWYDKGYKNMGYSWRTNLS
jgi:hypothetical protein